MKIIIEERDGDGAIRIHAPLMGLSARGLSLEGTSDMGVHCQRHQFKHNGSDDEDAQECRRHS